MKQKISKKQMKEIIERQPRIVLHRLNFTKLVSLGVKINGFPKEVKATTKKTTATRMTLRKNRSATKTDQKANIPKKSQPVKTVEIKARREIIRITTAFKLNNIVLVKWPHFPDWPAIIESIKGNSIHVRFFGDGRLVIYRKYVDF